MENAFSRLLKVLALERKQGYRNKAVIGGLDKFASRWETDARATGSHQALIGEIVALLIGYPSVEDPAARERIIDLVVRRMREAEAIGAGEAGGRPAARERQETAGEPAQAAGPAEGGTEPADSHPGGQATAQVPPLPRLTRPASGPRPHGADREQGEGRNEEATARSQAGGPTGAAESAGREAAPPRAKPVLPRPDRPGSQEWNPRTGRGGQRQPQVGHTGAANQPPAAQGSPGLVHRPATGGTPPNLRHAPGPAAQPASEDNAWGAAGPLEVPPGAEPAAADLADTPAAETSLAGAAAGAASTTQDVPAEGAAGVPEIPAGSAAAWPPPAAEEEGEALPGSGTGHAAGRGVLGWPADDWHFAEEEEEGPEAGEAPRRRPEPPRPPTRVESGPGRGLDAPVTRLPSIGPSLAEKLAKLGVATVRDLIYLLPRRYDDYSALRTIDTLHYGEEVTIIATVWQMHTRPLGENRKMVTAVVSDGTGEMQMTWFNPFVERQLHSGRAFLFSGKIDSFRGQLQMRSPEFEPLDSLQINTGRLVPIYPLTAGISARWLRRLMKNTVDAWVGAVPDFLPAAVRQQFDLLTLPAALAQIHFPENNNLLAAARRRLSFDEFFVLQLGVLASRQRFRCQPARRMQAGPDLLAPFTGNLPFAMTAAQSRALAEIAGDLAGDQPMSRLLQGDVGSGKTAVAAAALWLAVANGAQGAIMAPTEILAEQHVRSFQKLFAGLERPGTDRPLRIVLFTGRQRKAERDEALAALAAGEIDIAVGTHALIQDDVEFHDLAVTVVDEQHRFGVEQRAALRQKGTQPHMLVMSATPIPRSLALTVFGDLDVSVIDEMPAGRTPIRTKWLTSTQRERAYSFIRRQVEAGRQAFIIYPLVEESEASEAKAAVEEHERLQKHVFPDLRLGLLHGRLKGDDKDAVMRAFAAGELNVLVATSVVEVGIDVPNATVIVIEGAERFGLAQLHQFRGRVGRGEFQSYCILISDAAEGGSAQRLQALETSSDGFALAQTDLEMRGPGDFLGTRQSGLPPLLTAQLSDLRTLEEARAAAQQLFASDPQLTQPEHHALAERVAEFWHGTGDVS